MDLLASPPTPDTPLTGEQKAWIAGYLAGLKARPDVTAPAGGEELLVLYGTQSGHMDLRGSRVQRRALTDLSRSQTQTASRARK